MTENNLTTVIEKALISPDIDIIKMQQMLDMQERIMDKQAEVDFNLAMTELQPLLPMVHKSSDGVHKTKYAKYEDIDKVIRRFYTEKGFTPSYNSKRNPDNTTTFYGYCSHVSGHKREFEITLPSDTGGSKNNVQAVASSLSYAKRYLLQMMFNVITTGEDDDAQSVADKLDIISDEQAKAIKDELEILFNSGVEVDNAKFLKYAGAKSVDEIPMKNFDMAMKALKSKGAK